MFSFLSNKVAVEAAPFIRKIVDVTTPNRPVGYDQRMDRRYNRTLPVVICPSVDDRPDVRSSLMGISQDFSDHGLAVISSEPIPEAEYFVAVWPAHEECTEPTFFRVNLVSCRNFAHGFWSNGFLVTEVMNVEHRDKLAQFKQVAVTALRPAPEPESAPVADVS